MTTPADLLVHAAEVDARRACDAAERSPDDDALIAAAVDLVAAAIARRAMLDRART